MEMSGLASQRIQHDWPIEQAADEPDVQSLQEIRKPYIYTVLSLNLPNMSVTEYKY